MPTDNSFTDNEYINTKNELKTGFASLPSNAQTMIADSVSRFYSPLTQQLVVTPDMSPSEVAVKKSRALENTVNSLYKEFPNANKNVLRKSVQEYVNDQGILGSSLNTGLQQYNVDPTLAENILNAEAKLNNFTREQATNAFLGKPTKSLEEAPDDVKKAASLLQNNSTYSTPATEAIASVTAQQASTPVDNPYMHTSIDGFNVFAPALGSSEAPINLTEEQLRDNGFTSNAIRNQGESVNQYIQESLAKMNELGNEEPSTSSDATAPLYVDRYDVGRYGPEAVANDSVLMNQIEFTNAYNTSVNKYLDTMNKYLSQFGNASPEAFGTLKANAKVDLPTSIDYVLKYKNVKGSDENKRMLSGFIENTFNTIKSDNSLPESVRNKITVGDIAYAIIKAPIQDRLASTDSTEIADDLHVPSDFYDTLKSSVQNKQADISSYNKLKNLHQNFSSYQKATEKLLQTQQNILNFTNRFPNADAMTEMDKTIDKGYKNLIKKQYNDYEKTAKTFSEYLK